MMEWYYGNKGLQLAFDKGNVTKQHGIYTANFKVVVCYESKEDPNKFIFLVHEGPLSFEEEYVDKMDYSNEWILLESFEKGKRPYKSFKELIKNVWKEDPIVRQIVGKKRFGIN